MTREEMLRIAMERIDGAKAIPVWLHADWTLVTNLAKEAVAKDKQA